MLKMSNQDIEENYQPCDRITRAQLDRDIEQ
jgi:hypothetical protein